MCLENKCERLRKDDVVVTRRTHRALYYRHDRYLKREVARSIFQLLWRRQRVERGLYARAPRDHAALTLESDVVAAERSHKGAASGRAAPLALGRVRAPARGAETGAELNKPYARRHALLCRMLLADLGSVRSDESLLEDFKLILGSSCFRQQDGHPWIYTDPVLLKAMNEFGASIDDDLPESGVLQPRGARTVATGPKRSPRAVATEL